MAMETAALSAPVKPVGGPSGAGPADASSDAAFQQALATNAPQAAATPTAARAAPEIHRAALPHRGGSVGQEVLDRMEGLHKGDLKVRTGSDFQPRAPEPVSVVLPPGPAASPLTAGATPADKPVDPNDGFEANLRNLKELYDQAVQVSLMTKSTGSFNGTLNKLMSAQ